MSARIRWINGCSSPHSIFSRSLRAFAATVAEQLVLDSPTWFSWRCNERGELLQQLSRYFTSGASASVAWVNFGGRITVSSICQSCLILLTWMRCTLEPRSFKHTFVIGGKLFLQSVTASIQWTMTRAMTDLPHTCQPEAPDETRGIRNTWISLIHRQPVIAFDGQGVLCKDMAMCIPVNYHGYPAASSEEVRP